MMKLSFVFVLCLSTSWCYVVRLPEARLSQADWSSYNLREPEGPGSYYFGYDIEDAQTGNTQFRQEERSSDGTVTGSYGYVEPDGNVHTVYYTADKNGYRAKIENSRDNPMPPKASPRPGPTSLLGLPKPRYPQPVAIVPNTLITPNVVAPAHLIPSLNFEAPNKNYNKNFVPQSQFNDLNNLNQFPTAANYPGIYYVNQS